MKRIGGCPEDPDTDAAAPLALDRKKITPRQAELDRQRQDDLAVGRLVDLGNGGAWRRRCRPAP